jgi:glycosyltransferase involved in cell wall biosynthesis
MIFIASLSNSLADPRPKRLFEILLEAGYHVRILGIGHADSSYFGNELYVNGEKCQNRFFFTQITFLRHLRGAIFRFLHLIRLLIYLLSPTKLSSILLLRNCVNKNYRRKFVELAKDSKIIFVLDYALLPIAIKVAKVGKQSVVYEAREYYPGQKELTPGWKLFYSRVIRSIESRYILQVQHVFTVSHGLARLLKEEYSLAELPTVTYGFPKIAPLSLPWALRSKEIVFHGHITPDRYVDQAVLALAELERHWVLELRGIGDVSYINKLHDLAKRLGVEDRIRFHEPVEYENLISKTSTSSFGIMPWPNEVPQKQFAMPNKFFEYLLAGLPLIAVHNSEISDNIEKFNLGIIYDGTPKDLANKFGALTVHEIEVFLVNMSKFIKDHG